MAEADRNADTGRKRPACSAENVAFVILAAGFGTRLCRDIRASPPFSSLANVPKPLLPLAGRVLLDYWGDAIDGLSTVSSVVVVTNALHEQQYRVWAETARGFAGCPLQIVANGSLDNDSRLGAVADMRLGLDAVAAARNQVDIAVVIAGDTLIPDLDLAQRLNEFDQSQGDIGVLTYKLSDMGDCVRRGMVQLGKESMITGLVEKPSSPGKSPSSLATAPIYFIRREAWNTVSEFVVDKRKSGAGLKKRDAPGLWLAWALHQRRCIALHIERRIDIGGLEHYKNALIELADNDRPTQRHPSEPAIGRSLPRIGMLGNPSDGYNGRCIALAIESEGYAEVIATPGIDFAVIPNPVHEMPGSFSSIKECHDYVRERGIRHGARQLVLAGVSAFYDAIQNTTSACSRPLLNEMDVLLRKCHLYYSTSIPVCRGLSGSTALILATLRALARFCCTTLYHIDENQKSWPYRLLRAETELLGISGGLMDRVAQVYQGCTYMNFGSNNTFEVEVLDSNKIPAMWLGYPKGTTVGECSGKVHGHLRKRFEAGDTKIIEGMRTLAGLADAGRAALLVGKGAEILPELFARNWKTRLSLVGPENMPDENKRLVECADRAGFVGKMCGSGGAVLCIQKLGQTMTDEQIANASKIFDECGFMLRKVRVTPTASWGR